MSIHSPDTSTITGGVVGLGTGFLLNIEQTVHQITGISPLIVDVCIVVMTALIGGLMGYVGHETARAIHEWVRKHRG